MRQRGQTTTFQIRLEMSEHNTAGLNNTQIATALRCSVWTVRKWRRRSRKLGRVGLVSHMGRPATGPVSTFPTKLHLWLLALRVQVRFTRKRCRQGISCNNNLKL